MFAALIASASLSLAAQQASDIQNVTSLSDTCGQVATTALIHHVPVIAVYGETDVQEALGLFLVVQTKLHPDTDWQDRWNETYETESYVGLEKRIAFIEATAKALPVCMSVYRSTKTHFTQ